MRRVLGRAAYRAAVWSLGQHGVFRHLRDARRFVDLSEREVLEEQGKRLGEMLDWVRENHPYYGPRVGGGDLRKDPYSALRGLPLLERTTIQDDAIALATPGFRGRTVTKSTGGSTGAPVQIVKDADGVAQEMAASWAALEKYGIQMGDRSVRFWGTPLTRKRAVRFWLADVAMNRVRFSAFALDHDDFARYWRIADRFRPVWMYGYASVIHLFARWVEDQGMDGSRLGLRAIVPTSEPLNDRQREDIRRALGTPVHDEYGCGEVGAVGYGCARGMLHVVARNVVVECVDDDGSPVPAGVLGNLVITDLTNRAMPLLRYRVGDLGVLGTGCDCGAGAPFIDGVRGRIHDVVYTPAGRRWHGEKIDYLMSQLHQEVGGFRQYQVVQHRSDALRISLVAESEIADEIRRRIERYVADRLDGMRAEVRRVDRIERSASGKLRLVRNDWLPQSHQPHL